MMMCCHAMVAASMWHSPKTHSLMQSQVRALVDVLPEIQVVKDDPFNSSPTGEWHGEGDHSWNNGDLEPGGRVPCRQQVLEHERKCSLHTRVPTLLVFAPPL